MQPPQTEEVEADLKNLRFRVRGSDLLGGATLIGVIFTGYVLWQHMSDTHEAYKDFVSAIKEQVVAIKEQTVATREQNCLQRFSESERGKQADFCKAIAR